MIVIERANPRDPVARPLLDALSDTLAGITGDSGRSSFDPADMEKPGALFVLAYDATGKAVGCGGFRPLEPGIAEIKRMYAQPGTGGVGAALLAHLEAQGRGQSYREFWLETRRVNLRAVNFYLKHGYREIPNFGHYAGRPEAVCFGKSLAA
jgi:GNAT superfamily N-acetyltransferase